MSARGMMAMAATGLAVVATVASSQGTPQTTPGGWAPSFTQGSDFPAGMVAQRAAMERALQQIIAVLKATPAVSHPVGYCLTPLLDIRAPEPQWPTTPALKGWPVHAILGIMALNHSTTHSRCVNPASLSATSADNRQGNAAFDLWVNDLTPLLGEQADSDAVGPMVREPKRGDDVGGFPTFMNDRDTYVVITKRSAPLFANVSRERLLRSAIATDRERLGAMKGKTNNPLLANANKAVADHLTAMEQLLAGMSPAERASQAILGSFTTADDPFAGNRNMPLVTPNTAFFDRQRASGDVQLIVLRIPDDCGDGEDACPLSRPAAIKAIRELDWHALAAIVH